MFHTGGATTIGPDVTHPRAICQNLRGGGGGAGAGGQLAQLSFPLHQDRCASGTYNGLVGVGKYRSPRRLVVVLL